ncbi:cysteine-rich secretory protein family protein [Hirsutella rhossiliensis]
MDVGPRKRRRTELATQLQSGKLVGSGRLKHHQGHQGPSPLGSQNDGHDNDDGDSEDQRTQISRLSGGQNNNDLYNDNGDGKSQQTPSHTPFGKPEIQATVRQWHKYVRQKHHDTPNVAWDEDLAEDAQKQPTHCPESWDENKVARSWKDGHAAKWQKKAMYDVLDMVKVSMRIWWEWERLPLDWKTFKKLGRSCKRNMGKTVPARVEHFSQIIWKDTSCIGCAMSMCESFYGGLWESGRVAQNA